MADSRMGQGMYQMSPKYLVPKARTYSKNDEDISS